MSSTPSTKITGYSSGISSKFCGWQYQTWRLVDLSRVAGVIGLAVAQDTQKRHLYNQLVRSKRDVPFSQTQAAAIETIKQTRYDLKKTVIDIPDAEAIDQARQTHGKTPTSVSASDRYSSREQASTAPNPRKRPREYVAPQTPRKKGTGTSLVTPSGWEDIHDPSDEATPRASF